MIDVCPDPRTLSEEEALRLIDEHKEAFARAMHGTTLTVAVVDIAHRVMWAAGVGDSTIGEQVASLRLLGADQWRRSIIDPRQRRYAPRRATLRDTQLQES